MHWRMHSGRIGKARWRCAEASAPRELGSFRHFANIGRPGGKRDEANRSSEASDFGIGFVPPFWTS